MKRMVFVGVCLLFCFCTVTKAQDGGSYQHLFRFYYDNDFINVLGKGTDNEYTGGTRFDYFYTKTHDSRFFIDRWMPKAGGNSVNTFGWSIVQVGFTPDDIKKTDPDVNDYPYSGGIFAIHTLHSTNPLEKYNLQTELTAGLIGPYSYAAETQEGIHHWIHYQQPMGWDKQMPTDILLNLGITGEKLLWQPGKWMELSGGANLQAGTMVDGASIYGLLRIGNMNPYYDGYISQYGSPRKNKPHRSQIYITAKPGLSLTAYDAFVDGGVFTGRSAYYRVSSHGNQPYVTDKNVHAFIDAGLVIVTGKMSFSLTQKIMPPLLKGFGTHAVGNISITAGW